MCPRLCYAALGVECRFSKTDIYSNKTVLYSNIFLHSTIGIHILLKPNVELLVLILDAPRKTVQKMCDGPDHIFHRLIYAGFPKKSIAYSCTTLFDFMIELNTVIQDFY